MKKKEKALWEIYKPGNGKKELRSIPSRWKGNRGKGDRIRRNTPKMDPVLNFSIKNRVQARRKHKYGETSFGTKKEGV